MMEFNDFKEYAENVMGCSAALAFVTSKYKDELIKEKTSLDYFDDGFLATLDMLAIRLEGIAKGINSAVEFLESPAGEETRRILAAVEARAANE